MKFICLGDVVADIGLDAVKKVLPRLINKYGADFVVVNGENANKYNGISADDARELHFCGADVITTGNHVFKQKSIYPLLDEEDYIIRPANFPSSAPGTGYTEIKTPFGTVAVINLLGQVNVENVDNPFTTVDGLLKKSTQTTFWLTYMRKRRVKNAHSGFILTAKSRRFSEHIRIFRPQMNSFCRKVPHT